MLSLLKWNGWMLEGISRSCKRIPIEFGTDVKDSLENHINYPLFLKLRSRLY